MFIEEKSFGNLLSHKPVTITVMFPRKVYLNNFVNRNVITNVDCASKIYIYSVWFIGLQRIMLLDIKLPYVLLAFLYTLSLIAAVVYGSIGMSQPKKLGAIAKDMKLIQYIFFVVIGMCLWKRLRRYYNVLDKFDNTVGCRPKVTKCSVLVLVQMTVILLFFLALFLNFEGTLGIQHMPLHVLSVVESHYFGHLCSMLVSRIRLINFYVEPSLSNWKIADRPRDNEFIFFNKYHRNKLELDNLMDIYGIIVDAHDCLMDAIKWQVVIMLVTSFIFVLIIFYNIVVMFIINEVLVVMMVVKILMASVEISSMFAMCLCADRVRAEVRQLRELLAFTLYDGQLDKYKRSSARALLALTEARKLSFTLLRMVDISISLPFSLLGLLVTYIIILLQFQKIMSSTDL